MNNKTPKNKFTKEPVKLRSQYRDHSRKFSEWVDSLGFEQTFIGQIVQQLDQRFYVRKISLLFLFCLLLSFLLFFDFDFSQNVQVGDVAKSDLKSPISFVMIDEVATNKKRLGAEIAQPPVFDFDEKGFKGITDPVYRAFREMRALANKVSWPKNELDREERIKEFLVNKPRFEEFYGRSVTNQQFEWLVKNRFNARIENVIMEALSEWTSAPIIDIPKSLLNQNMTTLILKSADSGSSLAERQVNVDEFKDIKNEKRFNLKGNTSAAKFSSYGRKNLLALARVQLFANVTYDKSETTNRRNQARESVLPIQVSIKKNQTIVSQGSLIQPIHVTIFDEIQKRKSDRRTDFIALMTALLFVCMLLVFASYTRRYTLNRVRLDQKDLMVMGVATLGAVFITKIFLFMTEAAFVTKYGLPPHTFLFAAPVASAAMLIGLLVVSGEVVWMFAVFISIALSIMVEMKFAFFLMTLVGSVAAVRGVHNTERRNDIYWAGLRVGVVNALVVLFYTLLTRLSSADLVQELIWYVPASFFGGVFSAMVTMALIPIIEALFNYTTDIKLLELSNLNHPLMQEMVVKAPGTYHHSLVVGSMCDAAAKEIGANALLAKVMAYYHDIGKMDHAQYFIENQRQGYNPHDHVSPYMSKTILIAHVKDGAELGMKHKLGKPIIDGILQHHGTTLISYFFNKAIEEHNDSHDYVEESDFRYPGPKPQFKEAAVVMLADSIEAAARSLDDPTPARLQNIVQSIIQNKFLDGQLSDCDLTLQDLSIIEESFEHVILAMYHQRVEYPGQKEALDARQAGKQNVTNIKPKIGT